MKSVYRKFTDQIAADAASSASSVPPPPAFDWLAGSWTWSGRSYLYTITDYGISRDTEPLLIYNCAADMWILALAEPQAYGILIGRSMRNGEARFTGDITISGRRVRLRQTWRLIGGNTIEIENERMSGSTWVVMDRAVLERAKRLN